ncbi:hypothetical protein CYMTET_13670, partial [Cymbomonas tetramitiformis]
REGAGCWPHLQQPSDGEFGGCGCGDWPFPQSQDPEPFSPAAGRVPLKRTTGVAAHTRGQWMSPLEMDQQSRNTTQEQLGALLQDPDYREWIIANQHRISVRLERSNLDDEEEHFYED